jgi:hypothetical protein
VVVAALALAVAVGVPMLYHRTGQSDQRAKHAEGVAQANQQALQSANACIRVSCGTPVPTPSPTVVHGERGPGPTVAQIDAAVSGYCAARNDCIGTPSAEQVAAAVRAFCSAGACRGGRGAAGVSGLAGRPGESGAAGGTGPAPSDQEIADAVTAYCAAHGDCTGPAGPKGDVGDQGSTGPQLEGRRVSPAAASRRSTAPGSVSTS